jgi:hypothetical protein
VDPQLLIHAVETSFSREISLVDEPGLKAQHIPPRAQLLGTPGVGLAATGEIVVVKKTSWMRRMAGLLRARLREAEFIRVTDSRKARGKRWRLESVLNAVTLALLAGCKSFRAAEALTDEMSTALRRVLGVARRIADTTLREVVLGLEPDEMRDCIHRQIRSAHRRRALESLCFPFGVVALDGKSITSKTWDGKWASEHPLADGRGSVGLMKTITACLVSTAAKPCIDAVPMPAGTNEVAFLRGVIEELDRVYGKSQMFRMFTYDAGGCSEENAAFITAKGYEYLFALKDSQPQLLDAAKRILESVPPSHKTEDVLSDKSIVTRRVYWASPKLERTIRWGKHAQTFLCVTSKRVDKNGQVLHEETRYFVSSLHGTKLTPGQWLSLVRNHWAVENACHYTWDVAFAEDEHPWLEKAPKAMLCLALLRRLAANMLALFRAASRADENKMLPWKDLIRRIYNFAIAAEPAHFSGLRLRDSAAAFS